MISFLKKLFKFGKSNNVAQDNNIHEDISPNRSPIEFLETGKCLYSVKDKTYFIEELLKQLRNQGFTQKQIAQQTGLTQNQVKAKLQKLLNEGKIERKHVRIR